jgi:hypothetical protein
MYPPGGLVPRAVLALVLVILGTRAAHAADVRVALTVAPVSPIPLARLPALVLRVRVTNLTATSLDPVLDRSVLLVDGSPYTDWSLTLGNGPRDARWHALPAGQTLEFAYAMGDSLFHTRGTHVLVLRTPRGDSAPVRVDVR